MKAVFDTVNLAPGGVEFTSGLIVNGQQVNDVVEFYRAAAISVFPRGNRQMVVSFSVQRLFATYRKAERFCLEHFTLLAAQGALYLTIGSGTDTEVVRFDNAVPQGVQAGRPQGVTVPINYTFLCGLPAFDSAPPDTIEPSSDMIQRTRVSLTSGDTTKAITWPAAFLSTPIAARPSVEIPGGGDYVEGYVVAGSVTTTGCTVKFNAPIPGSGYFLSISANA